MHSPHSGSLLQVKLLLMPFSRDVKANPQDLAAMTAQLRFCTCTRAFVCVGREQRMSLELKAQVGIPPHPHRRLSSCFYSGCVPFSGDA